MKEKLMNLKYSLAVMLAALFMTTVFAACGDDDEENYDEKVYYSAGFTTTNSSSGDVYKEMNEIVSAFSSAIGEDLSKVNYFMYEGTVERCDSRVRAACRQAEASLSTKTWNGTYVYTVTNVNTKLVVYEFSTGTSN